MPIYDYKCSKCEHEIEVIQKINDKPKEVCPKCNKKGLKKQVSAPSFRLKGGGWYETDFKTGKKKNIASSDGAKNCLLYTSPSPRDTMSSRMPSSA